MRPITLFGLTLACVTLTAGAQTNLNRRSLSLKECVDLALEHNLSIQVERYSSQIAGYILKGSYGAYDPTLNLGASRNFVDQPAQFDPKKLGNMAPGVLGQDSEYELTVDSVGPALTGRLPTGMSYGLSARADHLSSQSFYLPSNPFFGFPAVVTNDYYATAGLTLSQPLLKDFWIDAYRRSIQINKKNLKISELAFRGHVMSNVTSVVQTYFDLINAREQVLVQRKALELAQQLLAQTGKRVQAGDLPPLDEKQAESSVEAIKTALFAAEQAYVEQGNALKNLLSDNYQIWADVAIEPSENLVAVPDQVNRAESWLLAMTQRPDVLEMRIELEKQGINVSYFYNQLFPSLNAVGTYGWQAVQPGFGATMDDLGHGSNPYYSFGVIVSYPLGNISARNTYKASQAAKQQAELRLKKMEQDVIAQVDTAVKLTETTFKQIGSSRKAREYAEEALNAEQKKLDVGASTPFFVLQFQRNLTDARSVEIRALADYNKAKAQLSLQEGSTLEKNKIQLKVK